MPSPKAGTLEFDPISKASVEFENPVSWDDEDDGLEKIENKITAEGSIGSILTPPTAV
jgi:hypothetical protein